jgi:accessory gene regulator B
MERKAHELSEQIAAQFKYDNDRKAVIAYGLVAFFQTIVLFLIISFIGIMCHFYYESLIIFFCVGLIKKSTGGAHSETMFGCMVISVFSIVLLSVFSRYVFSVPISFYLNIGLSATIFLICLYVFIKRVPIDSPNKPITKPEKIKRLRIQSFIILTVLSIISIILILFSTTNNRFLSLSAAIRLSLLWQTLMLTESVINLLKRIDSKFSV